jgi:TRAP-type C4-dicarboxylate transport system substrate-binding protein
MVLGALLGVITLAAPTLSAQAVEEIIFGISAPSGSLQQQTAAEFTKRANAKLSGVAVVKLFDSAQLGKDKELMQKLKLGTVHLALPSSIMSSVADEFGVFDMPFLVKDRGHLARIEDQLFWSEMAPAAGAKGYQVLAVWENGIRHITNNKRPINTPADLDGIDRKIPTPTSGPPNSPRCRNTCRSPAMYTARPIRPWARGSTIPWTQKSAIFWKIPRARSRPGRGPRARRPTMICEASWSRPA